MVLGDRFIDAGLVIEVAKGCPCDDCYYFFDNGLTGLCLEPDFVNLKCGDGLVYQHVADCLGDKEHWILDLCN